MVRTALRGPVTVCLSLLLAVLLVPPSPATAAQHAPAAGTLVYHQITNHPEGSGGVGFPVLSGDGETAVFVDAPGTGDPATPNRIFTIGADGTGATEVDAYQTGCYCGSIVDISDDGEAVVSTEGIQIRIADGAGARELVTLAGGEATALVIAGNGETVFFLVRRDTATADGATALPRGIWAIDADGGNLRQVVDAGAVADEIGVPVEQTGCCFHGSGHPLDVSASGGDVVFGAYAGDGEHVFAVNGDGGNLHVIRESLQYAMRVAISGDGATIAYDVLDLGASTNEIATVPFGGGEAQAYAVPPSQEFIQPLQLTADGGLLLVSPAALLIDTASGNARLLATSIYGVGGNHEAVLTDGLDRATMNGEGNRFLYAMRTARCADCVNLPEQLATLDIDPASLGEAPSITDGSIDPVTIGLDRASEATVQVTVESANTILGVGFAALLDDAVIDANVGPSRTLLDDGKAGDATANDGIYTAAAIFHAPITVRDPDTGPRTVRIAAEVEDGSGLRHATAIDIGTLTVTGG